MKTMLFEDARHYQILFLVTFLFLGIGTRDWTWKPESMVAVVISCVVTQMLLSTLDNWGKSENEHSTPPKHFSSGLYHLVLNSVKSSVITSLSLCLLLRSNDPRIMAIAGCLAISSKFLFRYRGKHFFNPANFGIIASLVLTHNAWVSPGQWGTDWWYLLVFVATGGMIINKVGRWDTSATFLSVYVGLSALRNLWLGWTWDVLEHQLMTGSLLLFAFFMITDPRSIPNARLGRILWASLIAIAAFVLQYYFYITTAIFWSLFLMSPLTLIIDQIWSAPRFTWQSKNFLILPTKLTQSIA